MNNDLLICELQKANEDLIEALIIAKDKNHNPAFLANKLKNIKIKNKGVYKCL